MNLLQEPPIGIILTMPKSWFSETGHTSETCLTAMLECLNDDENEWLFLKKTLPKQDFLYIYIIFDGKVQLRANLSGLERNTSYEWDDTPDRKARTFENKTGLNYADPQ